MHYNDEFKDYTDEELASAVAEEARHRGGITRSEAETLENVLALYLAGVTPSPLKDDEPVDAPFDPS